MKLKAFYFAIPISPFGTIFGYSNGAYSEEFYSLFYFNEEGD